MNRLRPPLWVWMAVVILFAILFVAAAIYVVAPQEHS
jgi:hypothetical protein